MKFYLRFQTDHAKGRMGPHWALTSLQKSYFKSSIAGVFTDHVVHNTKNQETQNKIFLQQLKTQSMNSGKYVTLSNWDIFLKFSKHFRTLPKIFENFQKVSQDRFENVPTFSKFFSKTPEDFRRFPKTSDNFRRFQKNSKMLEGYFKHFVTNFRRFLKTFDDFQRFL